jgi:hypothetical protein
MPSADFCLLAEDVATHGASEFVMIALTVTPTHVRQISPDKGWIIQDPENVNYPCTTAAFTLSP